MVKEFFFKGCNALYLESDEISVIVIPSMGGKLSSIYRKDRHFELLYQNKEDVYRKPKLYDSFAMYDASGFDDAFPTIDKSVVKQDNKEVHYPDHGEIWSADFKYRMEGEKLILSYESKILDYYYEKSLHIDKSVLTIEYKITNYGKEAIPCIWAMHCLIRCEKDMRLIFPKGTKEIINVYESKCLGELGRVHSFPLTKNMMGEDYYLDKVSGKEAGKAEKYYVFGKVNEGVCGAIYPTQGVEYLVTYDKEKLPYLGFWVTEGGFRGDYNCALEPTNGYYDSIAAAEREKGLFTLVPDKQLSFSINMELKNCN